MRNRKEKERIRVNKRIIKFKKMKRKESGENERKKYCEGELKIVLNSKMGRNREKERQLKFNK